MLKLLRSGDEGALLQVYEEGQRNLNSSPVMGDLLPESESVEWCPALICQASMIKRCWYIL